MASTPQTTAIADAASAGLASSGVVVDDITLNSAGRRKILRVFVARDLADLPHDDHTSLVDPLTLDEVADATSMLNDALDESGVMGEAPYTLEVSSVGVSTPLTRREHFRRNVGRLVRIQEHDGPDQTSRLLAAAPQGIRLEASGDRWLAYEQISRATVQVEFNRATTGAQN
ncbi:MAG: ribosome maturation factor RimP [Ornithinimicrobium sp.]